MKKSTIILIITGVLCTIGSVVCIIAATVKLADMGIDLAQTNINGQEFVWDTHDNWTYYSSTDDNGDTTPENVDVNLPFLNVHVNDDKVEVNMPGIQVNVDDDTDKVSVKIGGTEFGTADTTGTDTTAAIPITTDTTTTDTTAATTTQN